TLPQAFTIDQGGAPQVWVDVLGWSSLRAGRAQTYYIVYGNQGNADAYLAPIWVQFPSYMNVSVVGGITTPPSNGTPFDWSQVPPQIENSPNTVLQLIVPRIAAGATGVIPITVTVPDLPQYAHQSFRLQVWATEPWVIVPPQLLPPSERIGALLAANSIPSWFDVNWFNCITAIGNAFGPNGSCAQEIIASGIGTAETIVGLVLSRQLPDDTKLSTVQFLWSWIKPALITCGAAGIADATGYGEIATFISLALNGAGAIDACKTCIPQLFQTLRTLVGQVITSGDPNDKVGSQGVGPQQYISGSTPLRYAILFSNLDTATAPAPTVRIA